MKTFIIKTVIVFIALYFFFELTIGPRLDYYKYKIKKIENKFATREGRKDSIEKIKVEMKKAIEKENYLTQEEKDLIVQFLNKIKEELKEGKIK